MRDDGVDRVGTIDVENQGGEHRVHEKANDFSYGHSYEKLRKTVREHEQVCSPEREYPVWGRHAEIFQQWWASKREERLASQSQNTSQSTTELKSVHKTHKDDPRTPKILVGVRRRHEPGGVERNCSTSCRRLVNQCNAKLVEVCPLTMRHEADRSS